jgi:hypothetical protein
MKGLDAATAIYEWDYPRQMLYLRTVEATGGESRDAVRHDLFSEEFLLKRPAPAGHRAAHERAPVLLIDEVDRADQELEAFLLELLSDFQVTVPEIGTIRAEHVPVVILTSNRTREIHDALKRRLPLPLDRLPRITTRSSASCRRGAGSAGEPGAADRRPSPRGSAASISSSRRAWPRRSIGPGHCSRWALSDLNAQAVDDSLGVILKYQEDVDSVRGDVAANLVGPRACCGANRY